MQSYLQKPIRISTTDGRVFLGTFAGTDKPLNLLLSNAEEYKPAKSGGGMLEGRYVGMVLVPWRLVVKVEGEQAVPQPAASGWHDQMYI